MKKTARLQSRSIAFSLFFTFNAESSTCDFPHNLLRGEFLLARRASLISGLLAVGILISLPAFSRGRMDLRIADTDEYSGIAGDSLTTSLTRSGEESFFNGIIPVSPQAAALARYAEYPVSHATGIPDITIPLYEIRMGDFSLPISISYHASGARPDELHTCVGLGWSLNAGGVVTRTILSSPDLFEHDVHDSDYTYYRHSNVSELIKQSRIDKGDIGIINSLLNPESRCDSESDRYCFKAGGHSGVFRYSVDEGKYVLLDKSDYIVSSKGSGYGSYFEILCPDNTEYYFSVHEKTGPTSDGDEPLHTTSWYLSEIFTPYGNVNFTYRATDDKFFYNRQSVSFRGGKYPWWEWFLPNYGWTKKREFLITSQDSPITSMYFMQKLLTTIEWEGNRIDFNYSEGKSGELNMRLSSMTVTSSAGEVVKTVKFGNDTPWHPANSRPRRLLRSVEDSQSGTYRFKYDESAAMPNGFGKDTGWFTDSWGFYNGEGGSGPLSKGLLQWLRYDSVDHTKHILNISRDRSPNLRCTRLGALTEITFPTGGRVSYEYELNELHGVKYGGLRIASTTLTEGGRSKRTGYTYGNGKIDMVLFPGGYATIGVDKSVTFHYYTQDYLGNNRAIVNGSTGAIEQTTAYYPYGAVIPDLGTDNTRQPFKYGGKELVSANGLNMYDFGARLHYPAIPQFDRIDPLCEKFSWLSPYLYCANNPVNLKDKDGRDIWLLDSQGNLMNSISFDQFDMIAIQNQNDKTLKTWKGEYGSIKKQSSLRITEETEFNLFECADDEIGTSVFEFLADNSSVEWSHIKTGADGETQGNYISTSHDPGTERSSVHLYKTSLSDAFIREDIHNHPLGNDFPSGMDNRNKGDIAHARWLEYRNKDVVCKIYCSPNIKENIGKRYITYHSRSEKIDFERFVQPLPEYVITINKAH